MPLLLARALRSSSYSKQEHSTILLSTTTSPQRILATSRCPDTPWRFSMQQSPNIPFPKNFVDPQCFLKVVWMPGLVYLEKAPWFKQRPKYRKYYRKQIYGGGPRKSEHQHRCFSSGERRLRMVSLIPLPRMVVLGRLCRCRRNLSTSKRKGNGGSCSVKRVAL
jgi:hypothetical protein